MTVETTKDKVVLPGNGVATTFSFSPIVIFETTDVEVTLTDADGIDTLLTEGAGENNYTVVAASGSFPSLTGVTGSITYPSTGSNRVQSGETLTIRRFLPLLQLTDLENQGGYFADVQETALDKLTMQNIQQQEELNRAIKLSVSETTAVAFPTVAQRANRFAAFDSNGDIIASGGSPNTLIPVSPFMETLLDDLTAADALTTLGFTAFTQTLIDDADAATARTTLGAASLVANTFTGAQVFQVINDAGADIASIFLDLESTSPAINDSLPTIRFRGRNDAAELTEFVRLRARTEDVTDGSEDGRYEIITRRAGAFAARVSIGDGLYANLATGGDPGANRANFSGYELDGVDILPISPQTQQSTTSGSTKDFTGISSAARKITVLFDAVSPSAAQAIRIQIGDSGGLETSGYVGRVTNSTGTGAQINFSSDFACSRANAAGIEYHGSAVLTLMDPLTNKWHCLSTVVDTNTGFTFEVGSGVKSLSGTLDRVRILVNSGSFDAGSVNIIVE